MTIGLYIHLPACVFHSFGLRLGSNDGVVIARNMSTGAATKVKTQDKRNVYGGAHGGKVTGLAVIGPEVVTVGWDDSIRYADVAAGAYTASSSLDGQPVALAASPTNAGLLVVATNKGLALYNGKDKIAAISDAQLGFTPTCVAVQGSAEVCVGGDDNKAHFFSISDNVFTAGATIEGRSAVTSVAYSPDGAFLAVGDSGRQVDVYEKAANWAAKVKGRWCYHTARVAALSWSPNGQYLASGSLDERVIVWDLNNINNKTQLDFAHTGGVTGLAWADDSKLYSAGADHCVVAWNIPH
jgi:WD40 repeat protein